MTLDRFYDIVGLERSPIFYFASLVLFLIKYMSTFTGGGSSVRFVLALGTCFEGGFAYFFSFHIYIISYDDAFVNPFFNFIYDETINSTYGKGDGMTA